MIRSSDNISNISPIAYIALPTVILTNSNNCTVSL